MTYTNNDILFRSIEDLLESDDEFPDDYEESFNEIPSYKVDDRFDDIEFKWVQKNKYRQFEDALQNNTVKENKSSLHKLLQCLYEKSTAAQHGEKILIHKGILSKQDILCLRCFEPMASDASVLWFLNYLIQKQLQHKYNFLKSCLVYENKFDDTNYSDRYFYDADEKKGHTFTINLK